MQRALTLHLLLAVATTVSAADFSSECQRQWHQWRGPLANGTAPHGDPPVQWSQTSHVRWKTPIPGEGSATPIIWGDQVFVVAAIRTDRTVDALEKPKQEPPGGYKTERPKDYYRFAVLSLDRQTGRILWQRTATETVPHEGRHDTNSYASASPSTDGQRLYVSFGSRGVYGYDLASGRILWQCGGQTVNVVPSPVRIDDLAIAMSGFQGTAAYAIPLASSGDVTGAADRIAWHYKTATPYVPSPLLVGDRLYFTKWISPILTCLNARTGKVLMEAQRLPGLKNLYASPVAANGRIYFVSREGGGLVIKDQPTLEVLATNHLDDKFDASPAVVGRQLFLRGKGHLYCIADE